MREAKALVSLRMCARLFEALLLAKSILAAFNSEF